MQPSGSRLLLVPLDRCVSRFSYSKRIASRVVVLAEGMAKAPVARRCDGEASFVSGGAERAWRSKPGDVVDRQAIDQGVRDAAVDVTDVE